MNLIRATLTLLALILCLPLFFVGVIAACGVDWLQLANAKFRSYRPVPLLLCLFLLGCSHFTSPVASSAGRGGGEIRSLHSFSEDANKTTIGQHISQAALLPAITDRVPSNPPPLKTDQTWYWTCANFPNQTFQFISRSNITSPWSVLTNVVGQNSVSLPIRYAQEFVTIGATWITGDTNAVLRWEGWR